METPPPLSGPAIAWHVTKINLPPSMSAIQTQATDVMWMEAHFLIPETLPTNPFENRP
jgi:hypothetical protein